jgi:hypothetical protein
LINFDEHGSLHHVKEQIILLHHNAPPKPADGQPCNGCGVCCALETCPVARLRFLKISGPCPGLEWSERETRYHCGLLVNPGKYFGWLPNTAMPISRRLLTRWISAGKGCDCIADVQS